MRIGQGFDVHKFSDEKPLILGGIYIPDHKGLLGHSDGDVLLHAVIDALLGAAILGDIGKLFPDTNLAFKGINSRILLQKTWYKIIAKGYNIGNLDITIIAQTPKIESYVSKICTNLAKDLNCHINNINVKATTTEQLGFIGRGEGIACQAIVLLVS